MTETLEIVMCKFKDGVTDAQVLAAADALQRDVEAFDGYVSRRVLKGEEGQWVDLVQWTSLEAAQRASEAIATRPSARTFEEITDMSTVTMLHLHPVRTYEAGGAPFPQLAAMPGDA